MNIFQFCEQLFIPFNKLKKNVGKLMDSVRVVKNFLWSDNKYF